MLKVKNVNKYFKGVHALNDVSVELNKGEVIALLGDNGAGKSTLMKCVTGAMNPDKGEIIFNDTDISRCSPAQSRALRIEMIYQDLSLCKMQNVARNIFLGNEHTHFGFLRKKEMFAKCQEIFTELNLKISPKDLVGNLSGGRQQAVAIARSFLTNPELLIMDEPTAALGVRETAEILSSISTLKSKGVSIIMITHRLSDVFEVCDRAIVMQHGQIKYNLKSSETDLKDLTIKIIE